MRRWLAGLVALGAVWPLAVQAGALERERDLSGWFLRPRALAGLSDAPGRFLEFPDGAIGSEQISARPQAYFGAGLGLGYGWTAGGIPLSAVLDGSLNFRHDTDVEAAFPDGSEIYQANLRSWDLRLTLLADVLRFDWGSLYLGGGLGATRLETEVEIADSPVSAEHDKWVASPSLEAGLRLDGLFAGVIPEVSYRFRWLGDTESGTFSDGTRLAYEDIQVHDFALGFTVPLQQDSAGSAAGSGVDGELRGAHDWTGLHAGGFAGAGRVDGLAATDLVPTSESSGDAVFDLSSSGAFAGAELGVDRQWRWLVAGLAVEAGLLRLDASDSASTAGYGEVTTTFETDFYGGITARAGLAYGPWLLYGRGGVAFLHAEGVAGPLCTGAPCGATARDDAVLFGWTAGGGVEYALSSRWSVGAEYRYFDFYDDLRPVGPDSAGERVWQTIGPDGINGVHAVTARASYRF